MTDRLELIVNKNTHTISLGNSKIETGHAYYINKEDELNYTLQIFYRNRVPEFHNRILITNLHHTFFNNIILNHLDITSRKLNSEEGRLYIELSIPKCNYNLKILN